MSKLYCHNRVVPLLTLALLASLAGLSFLSFAPNRLVSGQGINLWQRPELHLWWLLVPLPILFTSALLSGRRGAWISLIGAELLFLALMWALIKASVAIGHQASPLARVSPGAGWWLALCLCLLIVNDAAARLARKAVWRWMLQAQIWLVPLYLLFNGAFDELSLLKEFANRQQLFNDALIRHLVLLSGTLIPALIISLPMGIWSARHPRGQSRVFTALNVIQTIPSVALFGLLIAPLAGLAEHFHWLADVGIGGIGMAPALIALVLYALLPLVRAVVTGLEHVPGSTLESARGIGMSRSQIARKVELPLALPVLLRGLKVVAVQTVGMAVIAALIGAGGLGSLVFQGVLSSAMDLVLLGVIPVVALAVLVDALFNLVIAALEVRHD